MVAENSFEEPNLSYVRVNQNCQAPLPEARRNGDLGENHSVRCHITKNMSPSDKHVVNAELLHKSMVEQTEPPPKVTVPLWTPAHLYAEGEARLLLYVEEKWKEITSDEPVSKWQIDTSKTVSSRGTKRPLSEPTELERNIIAKISRTAPKKNLEDALRKNDELEAENTELKDKVRELEQRIDIMSKIMKDPIKLGALMSHLKGLRQPQKVGISQTSCAQG